VQLSKGELDGPKGKTNLQRVSLFRAAGLAELRGE